jgi:uncharacterized protein
LCKLITIEVQTIFNPTEEIEILKKLFNRIYRFSEIDISEPDQNGVRTLKANGTGPKTLYFLFQQVRKQRIVEAVRKTVLNRMNPGNNTCTFLLNKQAMSQGYISVCHQSAESPMGPIYVTISAEDIEFVMEYLFPHTEDGKVFEADYSPKK